MNPLGTEVTGRRSLLNGLVTAATRSWRHGLQSNGHNSNALVFPTISTSVNNSPTFRTPTTDNANITEEQRRWQQQQQEHRLNLLWYGGDEMQRPQQSPAVLFELHNRFQSPDDWEKQPLRQQRRKSQQSQHQRIHNKRSAFPTSPIVWAVLLHTMYSAAMAAVYYIYGLTSGSGWIWLREVDSSSLFRWLCQLPPMWYFVGQAFCAVTIGYIWYQWQKQQRWCCYMLIALFISAILPSIPLSEVFGDKSMNITEVSMENSAERRKQLLQQLNYYNSEGFYENQLALYEGLWHMSFFIFVSYCLVWPTSVDGQSDNEDNATINEHNDNQKNIEDNYKEDRHISTAVLLFAIVASIGHTTLNMYIAYQQHKRLVNNSSMAAIQQLIANIVVLACVNLAGWLLRQSIIQDRNEIRSHEGNSRFDGKLKCLRLALRRQADKLNQLLTSLLPRRVFLEMKHDIVSDAARSLNAIRSSNDNSHRDDAELQSHQQKILLKTNNMPRMYLKEYENVSVVFANVTGFWDNAPLIGDHYNSGSQTSIQLITLIDRLLGNLFRKLAYRNHCLPIRLLGHRMYFIAGLPDEESYGYDDDEHKNSSWMMNDNGHARNAIQMGLDLIDAVNTVVRDISRCHDGHKINLNVRVGVHSGRVACGVLGFTGGTGIRSDSGSRWQYSAWGRDVHVASSIENSGRPGLVHVSRATVNQVTKKGVANTAVNRVNHLPPGVNLRNNTINYQTDSRNNLDDYSFERSHEEERNQFLRHNRIDTYFVIPRTVCPHSENNETLTDNYQIHDNNSGDIVSLILQSVDQQLLREEMRQRCAVTRLRPETEMESEQLPTISTTAEMPVTMTALIPVAPVASVMKRNRHRRSRYFEQESQQAVSTNLNTNSAITSSMERYGRWEDDVFVVCNNDDHEKVRDKSDDDDLFRIAKSQLLLLCVIIALFVVNVTTMPWTMLLGITFITPFVLTAGQLIYVMALLIDWIPRPRFFSTTYATAIIADDDEYYHHYDSDNNDSETSNSSNCGKCLRRFFGCHPGRYSLFAWLLKPFQCRTNTVMATRNHLASGDDWRKCSLKRCRCYGRHSWFSCCLNNEGASSCMSSDDSDIESRLGFRNENAIMAATTRTSPSQQQNRLQYSQPININTSYNKNLSRRRHRQLKRICQDEERRTYFYWICACCELIIVLLICLLALLNAFTCEPVEITATNTVYDQLHTHNTINSSGGFNTPTVNSTQQHRSPLTCMWPQYAVLTCCLVYVSIAIAFPIYYGSLPTLRMKIGILFVMTGVFAVAFVHFTHKHVFIAASMSSPIPSLFGKSDEFQNHRTNNTVTLNNNDHHEINDPVHSDGYRENQRLLTLQDREQQRVAGLNTATATVYAIAFAMATLACFMYKHRLQDRRALYRVKVDRDVRRLGVLREAHRRTLHAIVPEHVANLLRRSFSNNVNDADDECEGTQQQQNYVFVEPRPIPIRTTHQIQEHMPAYLSPPLYQCGYRAIVIMFATIVQQEQSLPTTIHNGENNDAIGHHCHKQLALLHNIFSEFDRLLDNQKYRGLIEKIKMLGTNTYMAAVGLQHNDGPKRRQVMLLENMKERRDDSGDEQEGQNSINNYHVNDLENEYELYNVISANYITFALDFIRDMRRALHRQQAATLTPVGSSNNSHPTQFVLRVGVNIGPAVAGLIGCNDRIWKRPQFDVWGDTVNVARQMDITSIPGRTQLATDVVDILKSMQHQKYQFDVHTKIISKDDRIFTYFIRESFERDNEHNSVHRKPSNYHHPQPRQISPYQYESNRSHQQNKQQTPARPSQNTHRSTPLHLTHDQPPLNAVPLVNIHSKHSHYNSIVQQDLRQKCLEPQKTPPPPPPPRSPPPVTTRRTQYPVQHQFSEERDLYPDIQNRSRGAHSSHSTQEQYQLNRCMPKSTASTAATYARPLQKQQQQSALVPVPPGLVRIFGDSQQLSPPNTPTTTEAKPMCSSSNHSTGETNLNTTLLNHQQSQQVRRPNVLLLKNTTSASTNKFDANRPLPDPPRSSDTVAGRHRNRDDPRRRRRRQHNQPPTITKQRQDAKQDINHDRCPGVVSPAWPSSSSFRSPISVGSFVSVSSPPSSLSSSGSTDAGGTTTSNNNYNTTTTASSSDDSYGCTTTEDGAGIDRVNTEDLDTGVSSVAISSVHHRYRQQQHLLLHQWSPSTTANSSPVRRSSSFRSPLSPGDNTAASSSSLRSPPVVGHTTTTNFGGTQSLNRRHVRPANTTTGAGSSSSRRRRRRQQQQNSAAIAGNSTSPAGVTPDVIGIMNNASNVSTEKYESSSSSPWKKHQQQQQRRQITSKDQATGGGVVGPDFTDEIRRILLLDHHRGNVRQQPGGPFKEELQVNKHCDDYADSKDRVNDNVDNHLSSSEQQHICTATVATTDRKSDKDDKKKRVEKDIVNTAAISVPTTVASTTSVTSASLFEERERQITEQVKRQQAEVRRILQEHKNNVVAVVKGPATVPADAISHSRKQRVMAVAVESSWSDDESLEPSSSLLDNKHRPQRIGFAVGMSDHEANGSIVTAETEYTTGGDGDDYTTDGDGYTTTGYTTDEAAAPASRETDMPYSSTGGLPDASTARQLDDNLSTMNDTGLTDAEAALSDVNSMIDYNDCNDNNRYRGRRQSSLSSNSVCPYASDSFCEDDDDYNDDGQYFFWDGYHVQNENVELGDDDDDNDSRYNQNRILLQQQLSVTHPSSSSPPSRADGCTGINKKRSHYPQQLQPSKTLQAGDSDTTINITQRPIMPDATTAATSTRLAQNPTSIASNTNINASPNCCSTATNTFSTNTDLDEPPPSSNIIKDMS